LTQKIARSILRLIGWTVAENLPGAHKYLFIGAPHTSYWDFPIGLLMGKALGLKFKFLMAEKFFHKPFNLGWGGWWLRKNGGIAVDRSRPNGLVDQVVAEFDAHDELVIALSPDGTTNKTDHWRSGFYYIALKANVPIALGFLDYGRKIAGIGKTIHPIGNIETDMNVIRDFYADKRGKHPERESDIRIKQERLLQAAVVFPRLDGEA